MKIRSVELKDFKRFTDLKVENIPKNAKLVILTGPNGCGKSSFFEGLNSWRTRNESTSERVNDQDYYVKGDVAGNEKYDVIHRYAKSEKIRVDFFPTMRVSKPQKEIYVRGPYRNTASFMLENIGKMGSVLEENKYKRLIQNEDVVKNNYQRLVSQGVNALFSEGGDQTLSEYRANVLDEINMCLKKLFKDLNLTSLGDPLMEGTFLFDKGAVKKFKYANLSGGEKSAFDLILDMIIKKKEFDDTVFCIDEPESHMNTKIQGKLLEALYLLIPDNCQLWLTTHSVGMMRKAFDLYKEKPEEVVFLDFGDRDFDVEQIIEPIKPDRVFWSKMLNLALDDLSDLVSPQRICLCEGRPAGEKKGGVDGFDASVYNIIFENEYPDTLFISVGGNNDVKAEGRGGFLLGTIKAITKGVVVMRLVDGDDQSPTEIDKSKEQGIRVLSRRMIENYLLDEEVITKFCESQNKKEKIDEVLKALEACKSKAKPKNSMKSIAGSFYSEIKEILGLTSMGSTYEAFMKGYLAPLISGDMQVYKELKQDIFD